ncbi:hypothetical protein IWX80_003080 [Flavobacterium sp. CAN_S2]
MPILEFNQYSAPVIYPKENYKVYKYFDIINSFRYYSVNRFSFVV